MAPRGIFTQKSTRFGAGADNRVLLRLRHADYSVERTGKDTLIVFYRFGWWELTLPNLDLGGQAHLNPNRNLKR